jgi:hypothetical protein
MSIGVGEDDLSFSPKQLRGVAGLSNHIRGFRRPLFPVKILQFMCGGNAFWIGLSFILKISLPLPFNPNVVH